MTTRLRSGATARTMSRLFPKEDRYVDDPNGWAADNGIFLWSKQREINDSIVENRYTAVKSCHGPGKSFDAAVLVNWWLRVHPVGDAFVVTTAPTGPQVYAILWRYIARLHARLRLPGRVNLDANYYLPIGGTEELVGYGRKPADYDPAAFQGIHQLYVLIILDEACGVPEALYNAVDSLATNDFARVLAIGNPDDPSSQFEKVCKPGSGWNTIQISAFDTPNFTGEKVPERLSQELVSRTWVEERRKRWGESSPLYVSKVLAEFPEVSDNTLLSPRLIEAAIARELPGYDVGTYGLDIARFGDDETCMYRNRGGVVRRVYQAHKQDTMTTADEVSGQLTNRHPRSAVPVWVDVIGIGSGVFDRLRQYGHDVRPFDAGGKPLGQPAPGDPKFHNRRAEGWWTVKLLFEDGEIDIDPTDEDLQSQLGSIRWFIDGKGVIHIESKDDLKKRGMPSPDRGDALMMSVQPSAFLMPLDTRQTPDLTSDLLERAM